MRFGGSHHFNDIRPETLDTAREAARRSGMAVGDWLNGVIQGAAARKGAEERNAPEIRHPVASERENGHPAQRMFQESPLSRRQSAVAHDGIDDVQHRNELPRYADQFGGPQDRLDAFNDRLDLLDRKLEQVFQMQFDIQQQTDALRRIFDGVVRLDQRFDQLVREGRETAALIEDRISIARRQPVDGIGDARARMR